MSKIIQSGGSFEMFNPINPINPIKVLSKTEILIEIISKTEITLTNNEIKDMKVIKCLENREILLWKVYSLH